MNLLEIIVVIAAAAMAISGFQSGFVRKLASMLSMILSVALVSVFLPYVTDFIKDNTPIYSYIETQCAGLVSEYAVNLTGYDITSTGSGLSGMSRDEIKSLLEQYGYGSYASMVDALSDEELEQYAAEYFPELIGDQSSQNDSSLQTQIIDELPLPGAVRKMLRNNNTEAGYQDLSVSTFTDYIVTSLSNLILDAISFLAAIILVQILLRAVITLLDILSHFPVISILNRLAGLGLGLMQALFLLWIFFLILTVLQTAGIGGSLFALVEQSRILTWLYDTNLFWTILAAV